MIGNLVVWLAMLGAAALASQWLLRRYRPRLRWSLRTMFAVVGLMAALCAWCAALRDRANTQDAVISEASNPPGHFYLHLEHWGPHWLDFFGARRFRRRIVGATVSNSGGGDEPFLERLGRLPGFRYLDLNALGPPPQMAAALGNLPPECLSTIGKLARLEELHLGGTIKSDDLAHLAGLTRLKTLGLQINWDADDEASDVYDFDEDEPNHAELKGATPLLAHLPTLPRLEAVELRSRPGSDGSAHTDTVGDQELRRLAILPRLKSLNLSGVDFTNAGLAELASLNSLEELVIAGDVVSPEGLRSLLALKRLKVLHILRYAAVTEATKAELPYQKDLQDRQRWYYYRIDEEEMEEDEEEETSGDAEDEMSDGDDTASDDEPESDDAPQFQRAMSPAGNQMLNALNSIKARHLDHCGVVDESDRLTIVALDRGDAIFALESEVDDFRGALQALRQANPGIVIDSDLKSFAPNLGLPYLSFLASPCGGP